MVPGFDIWRMKIELLIKTLPVAGLGEKRCRPPVAEVSTALFSTDKKRSAQWAVAPISVAEQESGSSEPPVAEILFISVHTVRSEAG